MKKKIQCLLFVFCSFIVVQANEADFKIANDLFQAGKFEASIEVYEKLVDSPYESSDLHYNLGNAYFRSGKLGPAILNYERALRLDPQNADAEHNLNFAQLRTFDKIDTLPPLFFKVWWTSLRTLATSNQWSKTSIVLFSCFITLLFVYIFGRRIWLRKTAFSLALIVLVGNLISFTLAYQSKQIVVEQKSAIVFAQTVTLKSTPDSSGTDLFVLHEGTKVWIKSTLGSWYEVRTADGNTAWLPSNAIEKI